MSHLHQIGRWQGLWKMDEHAQKRHTPREMCYVKTNDFGMISQWINSEDRFRSLSRGRFKQQCQGRIITRARGKATHKVWRNSCLPNSAQSKLGHAKSLISLKNQCFATRLATTNLLATAWRDRLGSWWAKTQGDLSISGLSKNSREQSEIFGGLFSAYTSIHFRV